MRKRVAGWLLILCLLFCFAAQGEGKVYFASEAEPFAEDAQTLDIYVCPLLGADCMVVTTQEQVMLVDMGKANDYATVQQVLNDLGIDHIDIAFNTHPHDDHLGGMKQLIADYPVALFMTAFPESYTGESVIQVSTLKAIRAAGIAVETVDNGTVFALGDAQARVIRQTRYKNPNPLSAMLKITFGECSVLLTADVIGSAQQEIAEKEDLKADIFKFPHHGLNTVMLEFLNAISPQYCSFTHGYANTKAAQAQLNKYHIPHDFATWGVIHLSTNGEYWIVEQTLNENGIRFTEKYR